MAQSPPPDTSVTLLTHDHFYSISVCIFHKSKAYHYLHPREAISIMSIFFGGCYHCTISCHKWEPFHSTAVNESHFHETFVNAGYIKIFSSLPSLVRCKGAPNYRTRKAHNDLTPTWGRWSHFHANLVSRGSNEAMAVKQISEADTRAEHLSILWFSKTTSNSRKCLCGIRFLTKLLPYQDRV